jgi:hypothetical protein
MMRRVVILIFIITVAANSVAGVSPHLDGDAGCSMACCQSAHQNDEHSSFSKLCCATDCKQPGGTQTTSASSLLSQIRHKASDVAHSFVSLETGSYASTKKFPKSPTTKMAGSSDRYLETSKLLI